MTRKQNEIDARIFLATQLIEEAERTLKILLETMDALAKMQAEIARVNQED